MERCFVCKDIVRKNGMFSRSYTLVDPDAEEIVLSNHRGSAYAALQSTSLSCIARRQSIIFRGAGSPDPVVGTLESTVDKSVEPNSTTCTMIGRGTSGGESSHIKIRIHNNCCLHPYAAVISFTHPILEKNVSFHCDACLWVKDSWTLPFYGNRITCASRKNVIFHEVGGGGEGRFAPPLPLLQIGKRGKHRYACDFSNLLTPLQAFMTGVALIEADRLLL